jgi:hypothetical protein
VLQHVAVDQAIDAPLVQAQRVRTQLLHVADRHAVEPPGGQLRRLRDALDAEVAAVRVDALVALAQRPGPAADVHDDLRVGRQQAQQVGVDPVVIVGEAHGSLLPGRRGVALLS